MRILAEELLDQDIIDGIAAPNLLTMNKRFGEGKSARFPVKDGVWIVYYDLSFNEDMCILPEQGRLLDFIWINLSLSGGIYYTQPDLACHLKTGHSAVFVSGQGDECLMQDYKKDSRCRTIGVLFEPEVFYTMTGRTPEEVYRLSKRELSGISRQAPPTMRSVAEQLLTTEFQGVDSRLFLEAKVLEFVAYKLGMLDHYCPEAGEPEPTYRSLAEKIHYAAELLERLMLNPPRVLDLSRRVGLNHIKLIQGFKDFFGYTPFEYLSKIRLQKAAKLIGSGELNITEAAFSVGYTSLSHFAKIFRNEFGMNPKEYAKHGVIFDK